MKYKNETLGRIEAVWNKLGGTEGVNDFLSGKTEVRKVDFRQFGKNILNDKVIFQLPFDYNHESVIDDFIKKTKQKESGFTTGNINFTSKNFCKATTRLKAGKKYRIKMFPILESVKFKTCLDFLEYNEGILVGAQGLVALYLNMPHVFPVKKHVLSFDEKNSLWKAPFDDHMFPSLYRKSRYNWSYHLNQLYDFYTSHDVILCFCEM